MAPTRVDIRTEDGVCPAYTFRPAEKGPLPAVLFFMDGIGIRPAMFIMGERLARAGYHVLMPDLYYRAGPYPPMDAKTVFTDPAKREELRSRFMSAATAPLVMRDTQAFLAHLSSLPEVKQPKVGTTGYCMGGRLSLCAAGTYPDRISAAASYHGGNLANDAPDSPVHLAAKIKARLYIAGASEDPSFPAEQKSRMEKALTDAKVDFVLETYPARHGWVPTDTPAHHPESAERHWKTLVELFDRTLKA